MQRLTNQYISDQLSDKRGAVAGHDAVPPQLAEVPHLGRDSPKLLNVAAWQLLNQLGSEILLRFPFVLGRRKTGFYYPNIWHSPIPVWQLQESLLADNLLHKRLVDTSVEKLPR
jgi:hypothetical protein